MVVDEVDPFDCFASDDDDDDDDNTEESDQVAHRDPANGALVFHSGTEMSLLVYLQNNLDATSTTTTTSSSSSSSSTTTTSTSTAASQVLNCVDDFCSRRHWMMHIGPQKREQLRIFLGECFHSFRPSPRRPFALLELGTYCGYSSVFFANELQKFDLDFKIYTVEVDKTNEDVAKKIIRMSQMEGHIQVLHLDLAEDQTISHLLATLEELHKVDFLFIDHDKEKYLTDLQLLESSGLIQKGTYVAADNIVFAQIDDYRTYIQTLQSNHIVSSKLEPSMLEYTEYVKATDDYSDGIVTLPEMSIYTKNPLFSGKEGT